MGSMATREWLMTATGERALAEGIRHRFPVFEHRTYLNSCSQGALSDAVRAAYESYLGTLGPKARCGASGPTGPSGCGARTPGCCTRARTASP
jgi:hypothetical protein